MLDEKREYPGGERPDSSTEALHRLDKPNCGSDLGRGGRGVLKVLTICRLVAPRAP